MAIKIDIPGIGEVSVEGAAQESTMQEILAAVRSQATQNKKVDTELGKAKKAEAEATKKATDALDDLIDQETKSMNEQKKATGEFTSKMKSATKDTIANLEVFSGELIKTATTVAFSMVKNIDENARDPIKFGAQLINTGVDMMAEALKIGVTAVSAFTSGLGGAVPLVGGGLQRLSDGLAEVTKSVIDFGSAVIKAGNEFMAAQFQKTVSSIQDMTKAGASFAGGMTEMRQIANQSGVGLESFTNVVKNSQDILHQFGMTGSESTRLLSKGMSDLVKVTKTVNGVQLTARDQLLNLGYTYEEQGVVLAQFMNQAKVAGRNLETMTSRELVEGSVEYAKNLKVISDITGQDAKKLMERAQAETMRSALLGKMDAEQQKAFQAAYSTLSAVPGELGPKLQVALSQMMAGGAVTDPIVAGNAQVMDMLREMTSSVSSGNKNMAADTQRMLSETANQVRGSSLNVATDLAALQGVTDPVVKGFADAGNALNAYSLSQANAGQASTDAASSQLTTTDAVSQGFSKAVEATTHFQVQMESLATDLMPKYASALVSAITMVEGVVSQGLEYMADPEKLKQDAQNKAKEVKDSVNEASKGFFEKYGTAIKAGLLIAGGTAALATGVGAPLGATMLGAAATGISASYGVAQMGKAKGGISSGPLSGYQEILHGTEAVVPLPDNRSIPVSLDNGTLNASLQQQNMILTEILSSMNKNNNLTSGILQNSY